MNLFSNDLPTLLEKAKEKRNKVVRQIDGLKEEVLSIQEEIQQETSLLMDFRLDDDTDGQAKCEKRIRVLKVSLSEKEDLISAYNSKLGKGILSEKETQKIREAVQKELDSTAKKAIPLREEMEAAEKQIEQLKARIETVKRDMPDVSTTRNAIKNQLEHILDCIEPRAIEISNYLDRNDFINKWMDGEDTESIFQPKPERKGLTIVDRSREALAKHQKTNHL